MKTAVEWFVEQLSSYTTTDGNIISHHQNITHLFEQAKEMEKQEIMNAWDDGYDKGTRDRLEKISNPVGNAEQYYTETFKSE